MPHEILLNSEDYPKIMEAYFVYISEAAKAIRNSLGSDATDAQIDLDVRDLIQFEFELAKVTHLYLCLSIFRLLFFMAGPNVVFSDHHTRRGEAR